MDVCAKALFELKSTLLVNGGPGDSLTLLGSPTAALLLHPKLS